MCFAFMFINKDVKIMSKKIYSLWLKGCISCVLFFPFLTHASSTGMPWESPLDKFVSSITGPVAFGVSVLGLVGAGATLIFGNGDMSGFLKIVIGLVLAISFIAFAVNILSAMFGVSSTLII